MPKKLNLSIFLERSNKIHNFKYDYSESIYINAQSKIKITCPIHGSFEQLANDHMRGIGCKSCGKDFWRTEDNTTKRYNQFLKSAEKIHGNKYSYDPKTFINNNTNIEITCPAHGGFTQLPSNHVSGSGCPECSKILYREKRVYDNEKFIELANKKHDNNYSYKLVNYYDSQSYVTITCPIHGNFTQKPYAHLNGHGCYECGAIQKSRNKVENYDWLKRVRSTHGDLYDYSKVTYFNNIEPVEIICKKHGEFRQSIHSHLKGHGCPSCGVMKSKMEEFVENILKLYNIDYVRNSKNTIKNKELDFYIPKYKLAIECNGNYWHSENNGGKDKKYHIEKTEKCEELGIKLIHIFEDEYMKTPKILKSKIKNNLKLTPYKIYARKCKVEEISTDDKNNFLNKYHIQGSDKSKYKFGLYFKNNLVGVMTFCNLRKCMGSVKNENTMELSRYATVFNFSIVGGAGKILKHFIKKYSYTNIISYADRRFSTGNVYTQLGFTKIRTTPPNYWYLEKETTFLKRRHRYNYAKHLLKNKLKIYDDDLSEWENMKNNGYDRIWDCGSIKYSYTV
jgi:very-short-patch-repair endonuclease